MAKDKKKKQEDKVKELEDSLKRAQADFVNYKRRIERDRKEANEMERFETIKEFLPIYESLDRAIAHIPEDEKGKEWIKGVLNIRKQFETKLSELGVKRMETVGKQFDPYFHEAMLAEESKGKKEGEIIEEFEPGYLYEDETKVLKHAKVKISK